MYFVLSPALLLSSMHSLAWKTPFKASDIQNKDSVSCGQPNQHCVNSFGRGLKVMGVGFNVSSSNEIVVIEQARIN